MPIRTLVWLLAGAAFAQDQPAAWSPFARLQDARYDSCAVRLTAGRVLIAGGTGVTGPLSSAELLSSDGTVQFAASMNAARAGHTCTLLNDGRVLVAGGAADGAEVYDPTTDAWTAISGNGVSRSAPTATLLMDGRVLIAGGSGDAVLASLDIFDPNANLLIPVEASLGQARRAHAAALLPDGRVILIGGDAGSGPIGSTEIFDPVAVSIVAGPDLNSPRSGHSATALEDGRILVAGGTDGATDLNTAELLDDQGQAWTVLESRLNVARTGHFAFLVPGNGGILLGGGSGGGQPLAATELFQPADLAFVALGSLTAPRSGLAGASVDDGVLLAMGGLNDGGPQSACGILLLPALTLTRPVYHPQDTAAVSGSNFPVGSTVSFSLDQVQGSSVTSLASRLLTSTVSPSNAAGNFVAAFPQVPIVLTIGADAGRQFRLTARFGRDFVVRTVPAKLVTTLAIPLPTPVLEGQSATFPIEVRRILPPGPLGGSVTATLGSNSISLPVSGPGTPVSANFQLQNLPAGPLAITATYSGDTLNDASSASATYTVASKTPIVELTSSLDSPQVGVPFTLFTRVRVNSNAPGAPPVTGTVTVSDSGIPIGSARLVTSLNSPAPEILTSLQFTALSFAQLRFTASFAGDAVYRNASSAVISPVVQQAQPAIRLFTPTTPIGQPVQFQCGDSTTFSALLTFPPTIGLSNRTFQLDGMGQDGSVRFLSSGTLVPSGTQVGSATGSVNATVPFNTRQLTATFTGDTFLKQARDLVLVSVQPVPVTTQFIAIPSSATNPFLMQVSVANAAPARCAVSGPEGTVEFFDGTASLGVVALPANTTPVSQIIDGTSNTILFGEANKTARLTVSRPVGIRNLKARYSGDAFHAPADTAVTPVNFQ